MDEFIHFIRSIVGIHDSDVQLVLSRCVRRSVSRGELSFVKVRLQINISLSFLVASGFFMIKMGGKPRLGYHLKMNFSRRFPA